MNNDAFFEIFFLKRIINREKRMDVNILPVFFLNWKIKNKKSRVSSLFFFLSVTGVRPYKCEDCGKCYRRSWGLKVHRYRHTGVKRFECDLCKSRFSVKTKLAKHIYGHIGEKPYKCDFCGRQYGERYQLKAHKCGNPSKTRIDRSFADSITQIVFFHPKSTNISFDSSTKSRWYSFCTTTLLGV